MIGSKDNCWVEAKSTSNDLAVFSLEKGSTLVDAVIHEQSCRPDDSLLRETVLCFSASIQSQRALVTVALQTVTAVPEVHVTTPFIHIFSIQWVTGTPSAPLWPVGQRSNLECPQILIGNRGVP
uniref:TFIIIC_delta domain-containing protein n=1 Tax=Steinernema glaseri TaxID=37863 RepID=A0A1I7YCF5_9BILA